jgi:YbbR domain-containing protein
MERDGGVMGFFTETLGWRFLLALVLSATLWARLTLEQNPERRDVYPTEIPVEQKGLAPNLVVANDIQPIKVRIAAPQDSWRNLQASSFRAFVDLSNATPGLQQPEVQVEVVDPDVRVLQRIPALVNVRIEEIKTATVPVKVNQLGSPPFGYRIVGNPTSTPPTVDVSGPSSAVDRVTEADVAVRLDEVKATVDRSVKPEPRGPAGVVSGVRVEPQSVTVNVQIEQIAGSKTVPVVARIAGQPAAGYWIGPITVDPASVQIVGDPGALEGITVLNTADVDVGGAQADVVRTVAINRPAGVTLVRDAAATVRVSILPVQGQQVRDLAVAVQGLGDGLTATIAPSSIAATISGPQPLLLRTGAQDVTATISAADQGPGTYTLPVQVQIPDGLRVDKVQPDKVTLTITGGGPDATPTGGGASTTPTP